MNEKTVTGYVAIRDVGPVSGDRGDLHRMVDELDEQLLADAAALLRALQPRPQRCRPSHGVGCR